MKSNKKCRMTVNSNDTISISNRRCLNPESHANQWLNYRDRNDGNKAAAALS